VLSGIVSVAALAVVAWAGLARGSEWKDRADERAERITALEEELRAAEGELRTVETRIEQLTEEVAAAQDQRSIAELTAEQAQELADLSGAVAQDLASCVEGTSELVRVVRALEAYDPAAATEYAEEVDEVCGRALAGNDLLQDSLGQEP
jgi:chromosome segregation ATPase